MAIIYHAEQTRDIFATNALADIPEEQTALGIARKYGKEQEWNAVLAEQKKSSGYRQSGKSLQDLLQEVCVPKLDRTPRVYSVDKDFLAVEDIQCVDADGNVFEQYDRLFVRKDVERNSRAHIYFSPYDAIVHMESGGLFQPSFALTCNFVAAFHSHRGDPEVKPTLMQYKDFGRGYNWHAQNTLIDWEEPKVIHYPNKSDFIQPSREMEINQARQRILLPFARTEKRRILPDRHLADTDLENGLKDPLMTRFVRQLTGLQNPSVLVDIGTYFGKTARVWVSSSNNAQAAWFGCNSYGLDLDGNDSLSGDDAARGVRLVAPQARREK